MRKYQVFLSSTFEDLRDERNEVIKSLLRNNCIPVGMEYFPASNLEQWEYIKKLIEQCDYYLVVIGGRYGSEDEEGVSYTQKEYEYAVSIGVPVAAILYRDIQELKLKYIDSDRDKTNKLLKFRGLVQKRLCNYYQNKHELAHEASIAIQHLISEFPRTGWIKHQPKEHSNVEKNDFQILSKKLQPKYLNRIKYASDGSLDLALSRKEILKFIDNISQHKNESLRLRNQLFIAATYSTGAKLQELNGLKIRDVLNIDGSLRRYCKTRIRKTSPLRLLFLNNYIFTQYLERYLKYRASESICENSDTYRGLNPNEYLFVSTRGEGFAMKLKKVNGNYYSSTNYLGKLLQQLHSKYSSKKIHIKDSGRKSIYSILRKKNIDTETISCVLGYVPSAELLENDYLLRKSLEVTYSLYD